MSKPVWEYKVRRVARVVVPVLMLALALLLLLGMMNYLEYSAEVSNAQGCHDRFGPDAEYVGETGGIGSDPAVICVVDGEQRLMPQPATEMAPLGEFLDWWVSGGGPVE